jgi:CubicO group peptidase (beta-lactamase class C family)
VRTVLFAVLAVWSSLSPARGGLVPELEAEVTRAVEEELREDGIPGGAVAIVQDDEVVYLRGFGNEQRGGRWRRGHPDTLFRLGSTTKMMTALVALDDAAAGRIDLDRPVRTYVKELHPALGKVTLRQLLTHTGGDGGGKALRGIAGRRRAGAHGAGVEGGRALRAGRDVFSYTSPGYWLAGYVLERVHGKPYAEVMRERLFEPLGMRRSTLRPLEAITHPLAQGHEGEGSDLKVVRPMAENTAQYPAGSVFSTARELATFVSVLLQGGRLGDRQVLSPEAVRRFFSADVPLPGGDGALYGFGLVSYPLAGTTVFEHGGVRRGYGSHLRFFPDKRGALVLLTNFNGATLGKARERITHAVFGLSEPPRPRRQGRRSPRPRRGGTSEPTPTRTWSGRRCSGTEPGSCSGPTPSSPSPARAATPSARRRGRSSPSSSGRGRSGRATSTADLLTSVRTGG